MSSEESPESDVHVEIQKTLSSINDITLKIKTELDAINELLKDNGQLQNAVTDANEMLTMVAENMNIDVEKVLSNTEDGNRLQSNLRSSLPTLPLAQQILACIRDQIP